MKLSPKSVKFHFIQRFRRQIGDVVRAARNKQKLSRRAFAEKYGVYERDLRRIEDGFHIAVDVALWHRVCVGCGIDEKAVLREAADAAYAFIMRELQ